jgi:hypothetical protein
MYTCTLHCASLEAKTHKFAQRTSVMRCVLALAKLKPAPAAWRAVTVSQEDTICILHYASLGEKIEQS